MDRIRKLRDHTYRYPSIYALSMMILFWTIFDSTMQYVTPLVIEQNGFSNTMIGIIIGSSSIAGAIFDFIVCRIFKRMNFRLIFLVMFAICLVYPFLIREANTLLFYLLLMVIWGIYFDLYSFGTFDFVGRFVKRKEHSSSFGVIQVFRSMGSLIGPLIIGIFVIDIVDWKAFAFGWGFLLIAIIFFAVLLILSPKRSEIVSPAEGRRNNIFVEFSLWKRLGSTILPILILTFFIFMIEGFFWTLAPLYAKTTGFRGFGGFLLVAYSLPMLFLGWFVGSITKKFGETRTAFLCFFVGSVILSSFYFLSSPYITILMVFIASCFIGIALPSINGVYANYISEASAVEKEITALEDFSFNLGYIFGPLMAGILSDVFSIPLAFSILGVAGSVTALILLKITPKKIAVKGKI